MSIGPIGGDCEQRLYDKTFPRLSYDWMPKESFLVPDSK